MTDSFIAASQNEDTTSYVSSSQLDETVDLADDDEACNFEDNMDIIKEQQEPKYDKDPLTAATMELMEKQMPAPLTGTGKRVAPKKQLAPKKRHKQWQVWWHLLKKVKKNWE